MGVGALDYALHGPYRSATIVAVDVSAERLDRLARLFPPEEAAERGVELSSSMPVRSTSSPSSATSATGRDSTT